MIPILALAIALAQPVDPACELMRSGSRISNHGTHIDSDDERGASIISYSTSDGVRCTSAVIVGRLRYTENEEDVLEVPFGGHAAFTERTLGTERELTITRGDNGGLNRSYRYNGHAAAWDEDAKRWLAGFLPQLLMDVGVNVAPRVARWRDQGRTDFVLQRIGTIKSSGSKRSHYEALMSNRLSDSDLDKLIRHAGRNIPSSGDLRAVLEKAAPARGGVRSGSALEEGITNLASSGDKTAVLELYGQTNDRGMLISVMRIARTIPSSGDKAGLLRGLAPRYLDTNDRDLYEPFYSTARTIPSSGDLRNVMTAAIPFAAKVPEQTMLVLDVAPSIASSGDRSDVLISLLRTGAVKGAAVREKFFDVAESVPSSGDRSRVLLAAARY